MKQTPLNLFQPQPFVADLSKETWMPASIWTDYEASNMGRVRSLKPLLKNPFAQPHHLALIVFRKGHRIATMVKIKRVHLAVHKLVWEAFYGKVPIGYKIYHRDGNNHNNVLDNLYLRKTIDHRPIPFKNIIGVRFGNLTALERSCNNKRWTCMCDCGEKVNYSIARLEDGTVVNCGKKCKATNKVYVKPKNIYLSYMGGAKRRNIQFHLTEDQVYQLIVLDCHYCGSKPYSNNVYRGFEIKANGIDRVDSNIGYIESNCVPCCKKCNWSKMDYDVTEWIAWATKVADRHRVL